MWDYEGFPVQHFSDEYLSVFATKIDDRQRLVLGDVAFPIIMSIHVPLGLSRVPVVLGDEIIKKDYQTMVYAGVVGMEATNNSSSDGQEVTSVQPRSGWWMSLQ